MPDPTDPGWRPEYTGDDSLGDVATDGKRLGAHLFYLYRAGRNELPELAAVYAGLTRRIHGIAGPMQTQFDRPGRGMDQAHLRLLDLRELAHEVLRTTCLRMLEVGQALVETADDYAALTRQRWMSSPGCWISTPRTTGIPNLPSCVHPVSTTRYPVGRRRACSTDRRRQ